MRAHQRGPETVPRSAASAVARVGEMAATAARRSAREDEAAGGAAPDRRRRFTIRYARCRTIELQLRSGENRASQYILHFHLLKKL